MIYTHSKKSIHYIWIIISIENKNIEQILFTFYIFYNPYGVTKARSYENQHKL